jgi:hypothetical protein
VAEEDVVGIRYQTKTGEDVGDIAGDVVRKLLE